MIQTVTKSSSMAKRPCQMTRDEVLEILSDSDDWTQMDVTDDSEDEWDMVDDPHEPIMGGSDDDFSDLGEVEDEDGAEDQLGNATSCPSSPGKAPVVSPPSRHTLPVQLTHPPSSCFVPNSVATPPSPRTSATNPPSPPAKAIPTSSSPSAPSWSSNLKPVTIKPFTSPVGPITAISESPLEVFQLFFTSDLFGEIIEESNRYARQVMGDEKFEQWEEMSEDELKAFLGFRILMGINHLPAMDDYWRREPTLHYAPVADWISRDRFRELSRYLHFVDNDTLVPCGSPGYDRLGKVHPIIDHVSQRFAELYQPHRDLAVDEAMIKFQGRSSLKQYMPFKPIKRGIKVWVLADSENGYFNKFEVYTGKICDSVEKGHGARVVKSLTADLKHKSHHVFFDNFFNSVQLLDDLLADGIYACRTARKDRKGFPSELKNVKLVKRYGI